MTTDPPRAMFIRDVSFTFAVVLLAPTFTPTALASEPEAEDAGNDDVVATDTEASAIETEERPPDTSDPTPEDGPASPDEGAEVVEPEETSAPEGAESELRTGADSTESSAESAAEAADSEPSDPALGVEESAEPLESGTAMDSESVQEGSEAAAETVASGATPSEAAPAVEADVPASSVPEVPEFALDAELWARGEARLNPYNAMGTAPDSYGVLTRTRIGVRAAYSAFSGLVQIQDVRQFGGLTGGQIRVHQGYVQAGSQDLWLRAGRQEINLGGQRFVGALNWAAAARSFDALRGHLKVHDFEVDAFAAMVRGPGSVPGAQAPDGSAMQSEGDYLAAAYVRWHAAEATTLDAYALYRHDGPIEANPDRSRDIVAPGLRFEMKSRPIELSLETMIQTGVDGGRNHLAFGLMGDVAVPFEMSVPTKLRLGGSYGSGQSADGSVDEIDNFFPTNHIYYGIVDVFGLRNNIEIHGGVTMTPADSNFVASATVYQFWLASETGRWSSAGGATLGQSDVPGSTALGMEADLVLTWKPLPNFLLTGGAGIFFPQAGAERLGQTDVQSFLYLQSGYHFR